jgi:hypothetical protein
LDAKSYRPNPAVPEEGAESQLGADALVNPARVELAAFQILATKTACRASKFQAFLWRT